MAELRYLNGRLAEIEWLDAARKPVTDSRNSAIAVVTYYDGEIEEYSVEYRHQMELILTPTK